MFDNIEKRINEKMATHTTLHIGGFARWFLLPKNVEELQAIFQECQECGIETFVLGGGSNLLVGDSGFEGAVISMKGFDKLEIIDDETIEVGAGVNLFSLNTFCMKNGLSGLEWSYGIPGTVGGACKMNAGAYGGEFCKFIKKITVFDEKSVKNRKKITFSYRKGCLKRNEVLISATLKLKKESPEKIKELQENYLALRKEKQPYGEFSLGSTFKRGKVFIPAKLIDEFGYKGAFCGEIQVSEKHAGFLINKGNGTAKDFIKMVSHIEKNALRKGYKFSREFVMLGDNK